VLFSRELSKLQSHRKKSDKRRELRKVYTRVE
jgi:hypothetical protein